MYLFQQQHRNVRLFSLQLKQLFRYAVATSDTKMDTHVSFTVPIDLHN